MFQGGLYGILAGMTVVSVIIVRSQIAIAQGEFSYDPLPTSIEGCSNGTIVDDSVSSITKSLNTVDDTFAFYKISFMW